MLVGTIYAMDEENEALAAEGIIEPDRELQGEFDTVPTSQSSLSKLQATVSHKFASRGACPVECFEEEGTPASAAGGAAW